MGSGRESFEEVLTAARAGQPWAAERLFRAHQPALLRYFRAREARGADDLAGEVWVGIARGLARFEGDELAFRAWVFSIARRQLAGWRRRGARRRQDPVDMSSDGDLYVEPDDPIEPLAASMSAQQSIGRLIAPLSRSQREVVLLRVVADLPAAAVAELMGRSENWVRVTQHRALRRMVAVSASDAEEMAPDRV